MKTYFKYIIAALSLFIHRAHAQTINWASFEENKHVVNLNIGLEHGMIFGVGYAYKVNSKLIPVAANVEYSFPAGKNLLDDHKVKIGAQVRWIEINNFQLSTKVNGVFRRYQNDYTRLVNFGSDMSGAIGYYRSKWFAAGEVGFDKAIVTHFKHSDLYRDAYPGVVDGWYEPATGGNFYYGLQTGFSFKRHDINLRAGKVITQDFKTKPLLPFYGLLGYNVRF